jgi:adrenodoxin-NADP+ reductase
MFRLFQSSTRQIRIFPAATNVGRSTINAITTSTRWLSSSSSSSSSSSENILKVAIVGSGPSGCYTAKYLQSALAKQNRPATLAIIERLPIPYGLVRHGVAPDHPEVKNAQHDFANLFTSELNDDSSNIPIQLYANVQVGQAVSLSELRHLYDVVVLAYGCESDRKLGIPGEDSLQGVLSAREFVAWYNGHVDYLHIGQQVKDALLLSKEKNTTNTTDTTNTNIVVIGQGNVALDCARILAKTKASLLDTDLASHALPILLDHPSEDAGDGEQPPQPPSRTIHVVGRRGHVQGAFTIKVGTPNRVNETCMGRENCFLSLTFVCFYFVFCFPMDNYKYMLGTSRADQIRRRMWCRLSCPPRRTGTGCDTSVFGRIESGTPQSTDQ